MSTDNKQPSEPGPDAMERITAAAIKIGPVVYTGPHHATIIHYVARCAGIKPVRGEQGFMTSTGRFVSRYQARRIALRAGQVDTLADSLLSEELWIVPDVPAHEIEQAVEAERARIAALLTERARAHRREALKHAPGTRQSDSWLDAAEAEESTARDVLESASSPSGELPRSEWIPPSTAGEPEKGAPSVPTCRFDTDGFCMTHGSIRRGLNWVCKSEGAPTATEPRMRICEFCKRTEVELGPIGMWQHCPEHEGGSLQHEMVVPEPQEKEPAPGHKETR